MKIFTFGVNVKPLSINEAFLTLRNGRRVRSKAHRAFAKDIKMLTRSHHLTYKAFESAFQPNIHEIHKTLKIGPWELCTQKGAISKKSGDVDNFCKPIRNPELITTTQRQKL